MLEFTMVEWSHLARIAIACRSIYSSTCIKKRRNSQDDGVRKPRCSPRWGNPIVSGITKSLALMVPSLLLPCGSDNVLRRSVVRMFFRWVSSSPCLSCAYYPLTECWPSGLDPSPPCVSKAKPYRHPDMYCCRVGFGHFRVTAL